LPPGWLPLFLFKAFTVDCVSGLGGASFTPGCWACSRKSLQKPKFSRWLFLSGWFLNRYRMVSFLSLFRDERPWFMSEAFWARPSCRVPASVSWIVELRCCHHLRFECFFVRGAGGFFGGGVRSCSSKAVFLLIFNSPPFFFSLERWSLSFWLLGSSLKSSVSTFFVTVRTVPCSHTISVRTSTSFILTCCAPP